MKEIKITIPGKPMGKQRPKFSSRGKFVKAITPEQTVNYETLVSMIYIEKYGNVMFESEEPLEMIINAYFQPPSNTSNKKMKQMLSGEIRPTKKPDFDNIAKIIGDALNAKAYPDDKQIVDACIHKYYAEAPKVEVIIKSLKKESEE